MNKCGWCGKNEVTPGLSMTIYSVGDKMEECGKNLGQMPVCLACYEDNYPVVQFKPPVTVNVPAMQHNLRYLQKYLAEAWHELILQKDHAVANRNFALAHLLRQEGDELKRIIARLKVTEPEGQQSDTSTKPPSA